MLGRASDLSKALWFQRLRLLASNGFCSTGLDLRNVFDWTTKDCKIALVQTFSGAFLKVKRTLERQAMPRANRYFLPGHVWHITHRCHHKTFLLKFEGRWGRLLLTSRTHLVTGVLLLFLSTGAF